MRKEDLSPEKQKEYDAIMDEIKKELDEIQPIPPGTLSCELGNRPYQEMAKKYVPKLQALLKSDEE